MRRDIKLTANDYYFGMNGVNPAIVFSRMTEEKSIDNETVARTMGLSEERFNSLLHDHSLFLHPYASQLEEMFDIDIPYFFMTLEMNYRKRIEERKNLCKGPDIRKFQPSTFWDVDMATIPWNSPDPSPIINRVYRYGNETEKQTVLDYYGQEKVDKALASSPSFLRKR